jgi:hypothetical protein
VLFVLQALRLHSQNNLEIWKKMARKSKNPINMSALLQRSTGTLAQIQEKSNSLALLTNIVRQICPDLPEDAFHIANCRQETLIIEVKSPVWGQRLQFERNNIATALFEQTNGNFTKIDIKVNPQGFSQSRIQKTENNQIATKQKENTIKSTDFVNEKTSKQFMEIAKNAPKGLKEKLEKLAKVAGGKF